MSRPSTTPATEQEVEHLYQEVDLLNRENASLLNRATAAELDYRLFYDEVVRLFNPGRVTGEDFAVTLAKALETAAAVLADLPCTCTISQDCARCQALGRSHNRPLPR